MLKLEDNLYTWAKSQIADLGPMEPLREQASSRKYYRVNSKGKSFILAFSDPQKELNDEFIKYSEFLIKNNFSVPRIEAFDAENGFMLIEDFGDKVFLDEVNSSNRKNLYLLAINQIIKLQSVETNDDINELNEISIKEQMRLFEKWFLLDYLKLEVHSLEKDIINDAYISISNKFLDQKRTLCHFDFELRNLMLREDGQ